jgi:hypothetical protein
MTGSSHSIYAFSPSGVIDHHELNNKFATETKDLIMKKLLLLALALAANLASAENFHHDRWNHHESHGFRLGPISVIGCLPSVPAGHWTTRYETIYVPGAYVTVANAYGQPQLTFVPAHYETVSRQVWVAGCL